MRGNPILRVLIEFDGMHRRSMMWQDATERAERRREAEEVFDLSQMLPEKVNRLPLAREPVYDADHAFSASHWGMLSSLAALHGDSIVHYLAVDDDEQLHNEWFGGISVPVETTNDEFVSMLVEHDRLVIDRLMTLPNVLAVWGPSKDWGVWCHRGVAGIVTTNRRDEIVYWQLEHGPFFSAEDSMFDIQHYNFGGRNSPQAKEFVRNYGFFSS